MKSLFPSTANSFKNLREYLKAVPNKIYSIEIKIKSEEVDELQESKNGLLRQPVVTKSLQVIDNKIVENENSRTISPEKLPIKLSQIEIKERTLSIVDSLKRSLTNSSLASLISLNLILKELYLHLQAYPMSSNCAIRQNILNKLIKIRERSQVKLNGDNRYSFFGQTAKLPFIQSSNESSQTKLLAKNCNKFINENSRQILSLLGHTDPPRGKGVRILSIDGGGTRGILVIEILRQIEHHYGQPIHKIFDMICGVSTGAIIAMLLGGLRITIDECEEYYKQVSSYLFKTDVFRGAGRLLWSHAYYDTAVYEKILKEIYGETVLMHTRKNKDCPHMVVISAIVNLPTLEPYLFRNYELHPSSKPLSHFAGGSSHKIWEAVRASSAAPGYFEEFTLKKYVHQDGGILINNPTAVAVHEAKLLWPKEQIQCVVSLGSGRYQPPTKKITNNESEDKEGPVALSSLRHKISKLIDSATDTEMVHRLMQDMMPDDVYYRMNPFLRDPSTIDENRPEKLEQMKQDALMYLRKNEHKFERSIKQLKIRRPYYQSMLDNMNLKYKTYF